jgi:hypothetical protein
MDISKFFSDNIVQPMVSAKDAFLSFFSSLASTVSNCGQTALDYVSSWANYFAPSLFGRVSVQDSSEQPPFEANLDEVFQELCAIAINNEDQQPQRVVQNGSSRISHLIRGKGALKSGLTSYQTIDRAVITAIFFQNISNLAVFLSKNPMDQSRRIDIL